MKAWLQSILLLRDDKQQVVTNGYTYLHVDSIAGCTVKGLDVQVLLIHLKKISICHLSRYSSANTFSTTFLSSPDCVEVQQRYSNDPGFEVGDAPRATAQQ